MPDFHCNQNKKNTHQTNYKLRHAIGELRNPSTTSPINLNAVV